MGNIAPTAAPLTSSSCMILPYRTRDPGGFDRPIEWVGNTELGSFCLFVGRSSGPQEDSTEPARSFWASLPLVSLCS